MGDQRGLGTYEEEAPAENYTFNSFFLFALAPPVRTLM